MDGATNLPGLPVALESVSIRAITTEDLPDFNRIYTNPHVRQFAGQQSQRPMSKLYLASTERYPYEVLIVEDTTTREILGWTGFRLYTDQVKIWLDLEIFLATASQRKGVGRQVIPAMVALAQTLGYPTQAQVHPDNAASSSLLSRLEWRKTAVQDDWDVWESPIAGGSDQLSSAA